MALPLVTMEEEVKVENSLSHKSYLIILKYIPHLTAFGYAISTLLQFLGLETIIVGYFIHMSLSFWLFCFLTSFVFKYCYVHRLPLYYIALNEILTIYDYYFNIPLSDNKLLVVHLLLIALLIFGYSIYYKNVKINKKFIRIDS